MEIYKKTIFSDSYEVSNLGNVKSLSRLVLDRLGNLNNLKKERLLKNRLCNGYLYISFYLNGGKKNHYIHRLVAQAFIPNPDNKPQVNHINGIKSDNRVENLEWCTNSENIQHAFKTGLSKKGDDHYTRKNVKIPKKVN